MVRPAVTLLVPELLTSALDTVEPSPVDRLVTVSVLVDVLGTSVPPSSVMSNLVLENSTVSAARLVVSCGSAGVLLKFWESEVSFTVCPSEVGSDGEVFGVEEAGVVSAVIVAGFVAGVSITKSVICFSFGCCFSILR